MELFSLSFSVSFSVVTVILFSRDLVISALIKDSHDTCKICLKHVLSSASSTAIIPAILARNHNPGMRGHSKSNYPAHWPGHLPPIPVGGGGGGQGEGGGGDTNDWCISALLFLNFLSRI